MSFDEKFFVSDEDMKIWSVMNPKALKGHAGHHVRITAQVDTTKTAIVVKSIRLLPATHEMPSNNDYRLNILPEPFPDYLQRGDIQIDDPGNERTTRLLADEIKLRRYRKARRFVFAEI